LGFLVPGRKIMDSGKKKRGERKRIRESGRASVSTWHRRYSVSEDVHPHYDHEPKKEGPLSSVEGLLGIFAKWG
jgi:hypothetical protein